MFGSFKEFAFDDLVCSHLLLQMNKCQSLFNFKVMDLGKGKLQELSTNWPHQDQSYISLSPTMKKSGQTSFESISSKYAVKNGRFPIDLYKLINAIRNANTKSWNIHYWLCITNMIIHNLKQYKKEELDILRQEFKKEDWNYLINQKWNEGESPDIFKMKLKQGSYYLVWESDSIQKVGDNEIMAVVTSNGWEKRNLPPSVFEYLSIASFMCCLLSLSIDHGGKLEGHSPSGCIFDYTLNTRYLRISMSNPFICKPCQGKIKDLEDTLKQKYPKEQICLTKDIENVLSKDWMGSLEKVGSPIYNLKKNYGYDIDRNSGFIKGKLERFRDSIIENSAGWVIGGLITTGLGIVSAFVLFINGIGK